jgi:predicted metal-dependent phosphoesterase TrpH
MGIADLHIHTSYSWDGTSTISAIFQSAKDRKLDIVAITDHDTIAGHDEAMKLAAQYHLKVIPGVEISTAEGHLLAYFIHQEIPPYLSLIRTIEWVGEQGGICVAAHPAARFVHSISEKSLCVAAGIPDFKDILVGVETINSGLLFQQSNQLATQFSKQYQLSPLGNSDSHIYWTVGDAVTSFSGESISDLRMNLITRKTRAILNTEKRVPAYYFQHINRRVLRMLGWVVNSSGPNHGYAMQRISEHQI